MSSIATEERSEAPVVPSPRVRRAWRILGATVAGLMLLGGIYQVVVALAHDEQTLEQQLDAAGIAMIEVRNGAGGPIRVIGGDTEVITVRAVVSDGLRQTGHDERVVGDRLVVNSGCPVFGSTFCAVDYVIEAPSDVDLLVRTDNGTIDVSDISGDVDLESDSSDIELAGLSGSVRADSDSADVEGTELASARVDVSSDSGGVRLDFDRAPQVVTANADSGNVEVVLPEGDETYRVDIGTDSGSQSMQVRTDPDSRRSIVASTDSGDVTVRYRRS